MTPSKCLFNNRKGAFANQKKSIRKIQRAKVCRFVWANKTGDFDPHTGRYDDTSAIGYLMNGKAEAFIRPIEYGTIDNKFVGYLSVPFISTTVSPFLLIDRLAIESVKKSFSALFHFLMPSTGFLTLLMAAFLLNWIFSALFWRLKKGRPPKRNRQIKILLFFKLLFLFFLRLLFSGNLNTENLVVQTDDLLYSKEQIIKTEKEWVFFRAVSLTVLNVFI